MPRPQLPAGTIGKIQVLPLPDGRFRARTRARDDAGIAHQMRALGLTPEEAAHNLRRNLAKRGIAGEVSLYPNSTIQEACTAWIENIRLRAELGSITFSTYERYETTARFTIIPQCGAIQLDALTVGRCDRIIQTIAVEKSIATARRARTILGLVLGHAVRDDAITSNPMRYIQRLPQSPKKTSILTPEQVSQIRILMEKWSTASHHGPRPDAAVLRDCMEIMLGTSARIGECLALRRCDIDLEAEPPTVSINGTIVQNKEKGTYRKDTPKQARQIRIVSLPPTAAQAVQMACRF